MKDRREWLREELWQFVENHPLSVRKLSPMIGVSLPTLRFFLYEDDKRAGINTLYRVEQFLKNHVHGKGNDEPCNYFRGRRLKSGVQKDGE